MVSLEIVSYSDFDLPRFSRRLRFCTLEMIRLLKISRWILKILCYFHFGEDSVNLTVVCENLGGFLQNLKNTFENCFILDLI